LEPAAGDPEAAVGVDQAAAGVNQAAVGVKLRNLRIVPLPAENRGKISGIRGREGPLRYARDPLLPGALAIALRLVRIHPAHALEQILRIGLLNIGRFSARHRRPAVGPTAPDWVVVASFQAWLESTG